MLLPKILYLKSLMKNRKKRLFVGRVPRNAQHGEKPDTNKPIGWCPVSPCVITHVGTPTYRQTAFSTLLNKSLKQGLVALAVILSIATVAHAETPQLESWAAAGTKYMVAADHPLASQVGARVLEHGGNAVDAAVAVSFALGVVRPYSTGLGGGGFMLIKEPGEKPIVIDFRERAPKACTPDQYLNDEGEQIRSTVHGVWAAGVPGTLKGMLYALEHFGTEPLPEVIQPAIELAEHGFPVDQHTHEGMVGLAEKFVGEDRPAEYQELTEIFLKNDQPLAVGDMMQRPNLAATLRTISQAGESPLYSPDGEIHQKLVSLMKTYGGPMTSGDLTGYEIAVRKPLQTGYRDFTVWSMPPPSSGGAVIGQVLHVVDVFRGKIPDPVLRQELFPHVLTESFKYALADRAAGLGDWDFDESGEIHQLVDRMIDTTTAQLIVEDISPAGIHPPEHYGTSTLGDDGGTSHYCVLDSEGRVVAVTETINLEFGSYVMIPGTGIILNDELDDFAIESGKPNQFGLIQSENNLIGPAKRPLSSMSPTIITQGERPIMVVGGSGGPKIITGTLHTILNVLEHGMRPDSAVAAPRYHHQWAPYEVKVEPGLDSMIIGGLAARGNETEEYEHPGHIQAIVRWDNQWVGVSDPRKGGKPAGK